MTRHPSLLVCRENGARVPPPLAHATERGENERSFVPGPGRVSRLSGLSFSLRGFFRSRPFLSSPFDQQAEVWGAARGAPGGRREDGVRRGFPSFSCLFFYECAMSALSGGSGWVSFGLFPFLTLGGYFPFPSPPVESGWMDLNLGLNYLFLTTWVQIQKKLNVPLPELHSIFCSIRIRLPSLPGSRGWRYGQHHTC